jgi:hypothetical protein
LKLKQKTANYGSVFVPGRSKNVVVVYYKWRKRELYAKLMYESVWWETKR